MKRSESNTGQKTAAEQAGICSIEEPTRVAQGIIGTAIEKDGESLIIEYDPRLISHESVRKEATRIALKAQRRFDRCVFRLDGRACEACALKLEKKAQKIDGVRRARATFISGVMSVTFDDEQISREQVIERVRETGAPATPFTLPRESPHNIRDWIQSHLAAIEAACTLVTFVFMLGGSLSPLFGLGRLWANAFFTVAYIAGGIFGVQASLRLQTASHLNCIVYCPI